MSRVGRNPITILSDIKIDHADQALKVQGPLGSLTCAIHPSITLQIKDKNIQVTRESDSKEHKALHGLYRSLIANMVIGVKEGFQKRLVIVGVGYRCTVKGKNIVFELGYSHSIVFRIPEGITAKAEDQTKILISGIDKQLVGDVSARIRALRPPEPYKGKGVHYEGEQIRRKVGKTATSQ